MTQQKNKTYKEMTEKEQIRFKIRVILEKCNKKTELEKIKKILGKINVDLMIYGEVKNDY